jgi:hypothetical protein
MATSLAWGQATIRVSATMSTWNRDRAWNSLTRGRRRVALGSAVAGRHRTAFDDGILAVCLFVVAGLVVLGGVLMLFYWVTATLPSSRLMSCPEVDSCVAPAPDRNQALWVDDSLTDGPKMTR